MLIDEPASLIFGQERRAGKFASDFSTLFEMRTRATYLSADFYGAWHLEAALRRQGVNFGDMRLIQTGVPTWDSYAEATYYEMKAGVSGIVQEGRYNTDWFDAQVFAATGLKWHQTPLQVLKFNYAMIDRKSTRLNSSH